MLKRFTVAAACATLTLPLVAQPASGAPTTSGARKAVEKQVRKDYRKSFGRGQYVVSECKKRKTTRKEIRYWCDWSIMSSTKRTSGNAWVYGSRRGRPNYYVILI